MIFFPKRVEFATEYSLYIYIYMKTVKICWNFFYLWKKYLKKKLTSSCSLFLLDLIIELYQGHFEHWSIQWLGFLPTIPHLTWANAVLFPASFLASAVRLRGSQGTCVRERESSRDRGQFPTGENRRGSHEVRVPFENLRSSGFFHPSPQDRKILRGCPTWQRSCLLVLVFLVWTR